MYNSKQTNKLMLPEMITLESKFLQSQHQHTVLDIYLNTRNFASLEQFCG